MRTGSVVKRARKKVNKPVDVSVTPSLWECVADLGLPNPEWALLRAQLGFTFRELIKDPGLSRTQAAKLLRISEEKAAMLMQGRAVNISIDRLIVYLTKLGQDVTIAVSSGRRLQSRPDRNDANASKIPLSLAIHLTVVTACACVRVGE